jgi:[acyl-carrier-protein] S-malonyltransferase
MNVQPAIVSVSLALLAAAREYTNDNLPAPVYVAGHSLGEYTALAVAGVLSPSTAICLARERGRLMQQAGQTSPGAMMAIIGLDEVSLFEICTQTNTYVANYNCPGQTVISGHTNNIEKAGEMAKTKGAARVITLNVSGAFHTPLMETVSKELSDYLDTLAFNNAAVPIIANTTAQEIDSADSIKTELICQLCYSVQWQHTIEYMLNKGVDTFIEIGPGKVLSGLIKRINKNCQNY